MDEWMKSAAMLLSILVPLLTGIGILWKKLDKIWKSINRMDRKKVSQKQCEKRRAQCCAASKKKKGDYMKQGFILIAALAGVFCLAGCASQETVSVSKNLFTGATVITIPDRKLYQLKLNYLP